MKAKNMAKMAAAASAAHRAYALIRRVSRLAYGVAIAATQRRRRRRWPRRRRRRTSALGMALMHHGIGGA
jgi:peptidoglycan/LPS O-acetylase OafA/YrhL